LESDSKGESWYVVGGRTYFEAALFGTYTSSFTYKGFFDQKGYEEPASTLNKIQSSGLIWIIVAACVVAIILTIVIIKCCCSDSGAKKVQKSKTE